MNRCWVLVLALVWPLCANAFQDQIMHLKGVTITATHSATRLCGVDFVIRVTDGDQHLVKIDYSYNGMFKSSSNAPDSSATGPRQTRSDKINVSVGRSTLHGNLARVAAPEFPLDTLVCRGWDFHFGASEYNASQDKRSHEDELKQKEQARLDEINRRKAEEAERKRKAEQQRQDYLDAQAKAKRDQLVAYKNASPENARCIINEPADITRCEQAKAREKADLLKRQAAEIDAQKQRDAKVLADARQADQFKQSELLYERQRADPCGVAADQARRGPPVPPQVQANSAAARQQAEALAQWKESQAGLDAMCAARKNNTQVVSPPAALSQQQPTRVTSAATVGRVIDTEALATKSEYGACRSAIMRSCFVPSKCEDSSQESPCVRVNCGSLPIGKDKHGDDVSAFLGGYSGGGPSGWPAGTILSADDYAAFRSDTWEEAMSERNRINICRERYAAHAFIGKYGNSAEKAATNTKTAAAPAVARDIASRSSERAGAPVGQATPQQQSTQQPTSDTVPTPDARRRWYRD